MVERSCINPAGVNPSFEHSPKGLGESDGDEQRIGGLDKITSTAIPLLITSGEHDIRAFVEVAVKAGLSVVAIHTLVRIVRHYYKFPMPEFLAGVIDNPVRRRIQPPDEMAERHGIKPGFRVLEVGSGNGTYTMGIARKVGPKGKVTAIDIEPRMIDRVKQRALKEGVANVEAKVADVFNLPFEDGTFDAVSMIAVIGEIPTPERALRELRRVLKPDGILATSELLIDPDYPLASTLTHWAEEGGMQLRKQAGNFLHYTLIFEKASSKSL